MSISLPTFVIKGERNSGTKYLRELLNHYFDSNFYNINNTKNDADGYYGWKHGFISDKDLQNINQENCIVIVIKKSIFSWLHSMYKTPYELVYNNKNFSGFIKKNNYMYDNYGGWIQQFYKKRGKYKEYKSVYHMRKIKYESFFNNKIKNLEYIKYEDLLENHQTFINYLSHKYNIPKINNNYNIIYNRKSYYINKEYLKYYNDHMLEIVKANMELNDY